MYLEEQLIKKDIKEYLKRILILICKNKVKKTKRRTSLKYEKINTKILEEI